MQHTSIMSGGISLVLDSNSVRTARSSRYTSSVSKACSSSVSRMTDSTRMRAFPLFPADSNPATSLRRALSCMEGGAFGWQ